MLVGRRPDRCRVGGEIARTERLACTVRQAGRWWNRTGQGGVLLTGKVPRQEFPSVRRRCRKLLVSLKERL